MTRFDRRYFTSALLIPIVSLSACTTPNPVRLPANAEMPAEIAATDFESTAVAEINPLFKDWVASQEEWAAAQKGDDVAKAIALTRKGTATTKLVERVFMSPSTPDYEAVLKVIDQKITEIPEKSPIGTEAFQLVKAIQFRWEREFGESLKAEVNGKREDGVEAGTNLVVYMVLAAFLTLGKAPTVAPAATRAYQTVWRGLSKIFKWNTNTTALVTAAAAGVGAVAVDRHLIRDRDGSKVPAPLALLKLGMPEVEPTRESLARLLGKSMGSAAIVGVLTKVLLPQSSKSPGILLATATIAASLAVEKFAVEPLVAAYDFKKLKKQLAESLHRLEGLISAKTPKEELLLQVESELSSQLVLSLTRRVYHPVLRAAEKFNQDLQEVRDQFGEKSGVFKMKEKILSAEYRSKIEKLSAGKPLHDVDQLTQQVLVLHDRAVKEFKKDHVSANADLIGSLKFRKEMFLPDMGKTP